MEYYKFKNGKVFFETFREKDGRGVIVEIYDFHTAISIKESIGSMYTAINQGYCIECDQQEFEEAYNYALNIISK